MSRHLYNAVLPDGREVLVVGGWDRMLGHFFFDVFPRGTDRDEEPIHSSLEGDNPFGAEITPLLLPLAAAGILPPHEMISEIIDDKENDAGGKIVRHETGPNGTHIRKLIRPG